MARIIATTDPPTQHTAPALLGESVYSIHLDTGVRLRCRVLSALAALAVLLLLPASALGLATRTWVSGVGEDANPCSRTAPCKTFAGAISQTVAGGEIDALDSGGFGAVTITKAITISGTGVTASVVVSGTNGIVVAAGPNDAVVLHGIAVDGIGTGLSGIRFLSGKSLRVEDGSIFSFTGSGIDFESSTPGSSLLVENTSIHDNGGDGVLVLPPVGVSGNALLDGSFVENNACGVVAGTFGPSGSFATNCGTAESGAAATAATVSSANTSISDNAGVGVLSNGSGASNAISSDLITGNGTGLQAVNGGSIASVGANAVFGNSTNGSPTSSVSVTAGLAGPPGSGGAAGPRGATGPAGEVELITCKSITVTVVKKVHGKRKKVKATKQKCTGQLVSGAVSFTTGGARATLSRAGAVYATGTMVIGRRGEQGQLHPRRHLPIGPYTLTLSQGHRVISRQTVNVR